MRPPKATRNDPVLHGNLEFTAAVGTVPDGYDLEILIVTIGVILIVAFSTYFERKVIGSMQARIGPNRVGPLGLGNLSQTLSSSSSKRSLFRRSRASFCLS